VAVATLPEALRQVVWMCHIEGQSVREIAAALGRTERAVNQLCYRGLLKLREQMGHRSRFLSDSR
jgi:RNA polymerase sigma factor (sigma-70 family)